MFEGCPKKEDRPFCLPDVRLGALFSISHHFTSSLQSWPSFLCCETFFERRTPQAWIHDPRSSEWKRGTQAAVPRFCRLLRNESLLSGTAQAFFPLLSGQSHSFFPPTETELRKPPNCFYKQAAMAYHLFSMAWSGLVRAACVNKKFYCVPWLGLPGKNRDLVTSGLNLPKCP